MPKTVTELRIFVYPGCDRTAANADLEAAYIGEGSKIKRYALAHAEALSLEAMGAIKKGEPFALWGCLEDREIVESVRPATGSRGVMKADGTWTNAPVAPVPADAVDEEEAVPFSE
jgi:hypothetical protein